MQQVLKLTIGIALGLMLGFLGIQAMSGLELRAAVQSMRPPPIASAPTPQSKQQSAQLPTVDPYNTCRHGKVGEDKNLTVDQWIALDFACAEREHTEEFGQ